MQAGHTFFARDAPEIAIQRLFDKYDLEKNGKLDEEQLRKLLEDDLGLSREQSCIYFRLNCKHSGEFGQNFSKSQMPGVCH